VQLDLAPHLIGGHGDYVGETSFRALAPLTFDENVVSAAAAVRWPANVHVRTAGLRLCQPQPNHRCASLGHRALIVRRGRGQFADGTGPWPRARSRLRFRSEKDNDHNPRQHPPSAPQAPSFLQSRNGRAGRLSGRLFSCAPPDCLFSDVANLRHGRGRNDLLHTHEVTIAELDPAAADTGPPVRFAARAPRARSAADWAIRLPPANWSM